MKTFCLWLGFGIVVGCEEPPPKAPPPPPEPQEAPDIPTYCASAAKPCVPPPDFVELLCRDRFASVAPYLFQKHTPFVRLHVKSRSVELGNSFKGPTGSNAVAFAEELVLLRVISESAENAKKPPLERYDLLRWDGTCLTLPKTDVVTYLPGMPQAAPVEFNEFDSTMRVALLRDKKIGKLHDDRERVCQQGQASEGCTKASKALSEGIVGAIRQGLRLPMPRERPSHKAKTVPVRTAPAASGSARGD